MIKFILLIVFAFIIFLILTSLWGFYNSVRPQKFISTILPKDFQLDYQEITLTTTDGLKLAGWFIPAISGKTDKAIIGLHGYPADKGNILPAIKNLAQDYNLLLFDFRYHGQSQGSYTTIGAKEINDLLAAISFLENKDINQIGIWGFSMGGAVALMTMPKAEAIKAVAADSSYANLGNMATELFLLPGLKKPLALLVQLWGKIFLGIDIKKVSPSQAVQNLDKPVLIIHSKKDEVIPFSNALQLQQALINNPKAEFWFTDTQFHGMTSQDYQQRIADFFKQNL